MQNNRETLDDLAKKSNKFSENMAILQITFEKINKERVRLDKREKELANDRFILNSHISELEQNLITLMNSMTGFQEEAISIASDLYDRVQAEADYRAKAEATQRGIAEAAHKVLAESAERAREEAEYRIKVETMQRGLLENAKKAQAEAAIKIQSEFSKERVSVTIEPDSEEAVFEPQAN